MNPTYGKERGPELFKRGMTVVASSCLALSAATFMFSGSAKAADVPALTDDQKNAEIIAFGDQHPDDLVGLDDLVFKYTGSHIQVGISGQTEAVGATEAEEILGQEPGSAKFQAAAGGIPDFKPTIVASELAGPPNMYRVTGRWNFPDSWAGQKSPFDIAALSFNGLKSCLQLGGYNISTFSVTGTNTGLGTLRTSTGGTNGVWNVQDGEVGFESQADHGGAGLTIKDTCGGKSTKVGAAFDYEANAGGSIAGVSVAWGLLSVTYNSSGLKREQGTPPVYFTL